MGLDRSVKNTFFDLRSRLSTARLTRSFLSDVIEKIVVIFGCTAFDSEDTDPEWKGKLHIPGGQSVKGGWIYKEGEMTPVISAIKKTRRNRQMLFPESVEMTMIDARQRSFTVKGTITAAANWKTWHNFDSIICLTRWECEGLTSYGDFQECHWSDYIHLMQS